MALKLSLLSLLLLGSHGFQIPAHLASRSLTRVSLLPARQESFFPFQPRTSETSLQAKQDVDNSGNIRQLLGVKGAAQETDIWKIRLQLTKPVTWVPLVWYVCSPSKVGMQFYREKVMSTFLHFLSSYHLLSSFAYMGVMCGAAASGNYHWIWNPFDPNDRDVALGLTDAAKGFVAMVSTESYSLMLYLF